MTDGSLVNTTNTPACISSPSKATVKLSSIQISFSSAYNAHLQPLSVIPATVVCEQPTNCNNGPALFSFKADAAHTLPLPFIDLPSLDTTLQIGIGLTKNTSSSALFHPVNTDIQQATPYAQTVQQSITPIRLPLNDKKRINEPGMPVVNTTGELTGIFLSGNATQPFAISDIRNFLDQQGGLVPPQENPVHANWKTGITAFYQKNYQTAHTAFHNAAIANPQFQGAKDLEQLATPPPATETQPNTFTFYGISISLEELIILLVLLVLIVLMVLAGLTFGRARAQRARTLKAEYAEAERRAAIDAQQIQIAEMETAQQQPWSQPTIPFQHSPNSVTGKTEHPSAPELRCPRCSKPITRGANYCSNCRLSLSPSESGLHLRIPPAAFAAPAPQVTSLRPSGSIAEQPTVEILPKNGQIESEKTIPYAMRHMKGHRLGLVVGTRSDPGIKRKYKPNEDSVFAAQGAHTANSSPLQFGLFVIADGMGGHANGQDASRQAIQTIVDYMLPKIMKNSELQSEDLERLLAEGVQHANQTVHQHNMEMHADMGTTVTAALIVDTTAYITNVGDSRTYLYSESKGLSKVTHDHLVVASLVEAGIIKPDDIYTHPKRNQIYRSLGEKPSVEVDSFSVQLRSGDKLLLCSDGLWDMVRDPKIEELLKNHVPNPSITVDSLIQAALEGGGEDNVSVIVVSVTETAQQAPTSGFQLLAKPESVQLPQV